MWADVGRFDPEMVGLRVSALTRQANLRRRTIPHNFETKGNPEWDWGP